MKDTPSALRDSVKRARPRRLTGMACIAGLAGSVLVAGGVRADEIIRYRTPGSTFPIARAVEVPAGRTTVYLSGVIPPIIDTSVARDSREAFGDTKTQTIGVLTTIEHTLRDMNLTMGDVVKMRVSLVGDAAKGGRMDFAGMMEGYRQFFGTPEQPNLPARAVVQVAGLVNPGWLVEIEVTAVRP